MVSALAFTATAIASLFAEAMLVRFLGGRRPHQRAWAIALAMFALASAALATGVSTGWDAGTFRVFYLFGAVINVPWLALGTVYLLLGAGTGRRAQGGLVLFTGIAIGAVLAAPIERVHGHAIPVGKDVFGAFPRVLAALGSSVGATVILVGASWSAVRYLRSRGQPGGARRAGSNLLIALGTLVLASGGLVQGLIGDDEAFTLSLTLGIAVIFAGFRVAEGRRAEHRPPGS